MSKESLKYFKGDELAASVWQSKYAVDGESSPDDMHRRMAKEFARIEYKYQSSIRENKEVRGYDSISNYGKKRNFLTESSIFELFKDFKYVIPQGSIMATLGTGQIASLSNCWVVDSPLDSYAGIHKTDGDLIYYYKRRGGVGVDISKLRPANTETNNAAKTTTGAVSFMHRFSNTTREVAMNGRRGALMISIDINHPDVMDFIKVKRDGTSVTGANISIRLNNEFMKAVEDDGDYVLRYPCGTKIDKVSESCEYDKLYTQVCPTNKNTFYYKRIKAKKYWDEIVHSAKNFAEPGLMYWDNALEYDPAGVYEQYKPISTNPCVSGDTLVLTPNGYVRADSINEGDILSTVIGEEPVKTKEVNHNMQLYKVGFSDGGSVRVTASHQFHARVKNSKFIKEVELRNLSIGDSVRIGGAVGLVNIPKNEEYILGLKQGIILGDGCFTKNTETIKIATNVEDTEYNKNVKTLFRESNFRKDDVSKDSKSMSMVTKSEYSKELTKELEIESGYSYEKNIDLTQVKGQSQMLGILDGLLATDGNVNLRSNHPQIRFFTTSPKLAENIRLMLLAIGSYGIITKSNDVGGNIDGREIKRNHTKYSINVSGESFRNYALKSYLKDLHPEKGRDMVKALSTAILSGNNWSTKITSIEEDGIETVYDFFCEESDTWLTNGYVSRGCGEQFLQANDSCRLMVHNLVSYVDNPFTDKAKFNVEMFYENAYECARLGDDLVDLEAEYIQRIIDKIESDPEPNHIKHQELELWKKSKEICLQGRRVGIGITALGDTLASLGIKYDSDEGLDMIEQIMQVKMKAELDCTVDLAITRGAFNGWDKDLEYPTSNNENKLYGNKFYYTLQVEFPDQVSRMTKYGRRNISWSTIAPTGSVSLLAGNCTSGCEPLFQPFYMRRKKINPGEAGVRVDFVDEIGDSWQEFPVLHPKFKEWIISLYNTDNPIWWNVQGLDMRKLYNIPIVSENKEILQKYFEESPWYGSTANDIDWKKRVEIQSVLQKYTTNAISSTINLPSTVTYEEVSDIYMHGWKKGLKGQTVYVDGSRSGVLVTENKKELVTFNENHAPKRPKSLACKVVRFNNNYEKWIAFVGLLDNKPYEVFTGKAENVDLPTTIESGEIRKVKDESDKRYDFIYEGGRIERISTVSSSDYWNYGKLISGMLRHGMPLPFVVDTIQSLNWDSDHINTWKAGISRALKKFIKDGKAVGFTCNDCGSEQVVFQEGCLRCNNCGSSKCG